MATITVTVGMGRWPFDRLILGVSPLCSEHRVFMQTGTSTIRPPCPHAPFVPYDELMDRLRASDIVITHAGNTVRIVQRMGKVPIAVARQASLGEMGNDHQVDYLRYEEPRGPVIAVWDVDRLAEAVRGHPETQARLLAERPMSSPVDGRRVADLLDGLCYRLLRERAGG